MSRSKAQLAAALLSTPEDAEQQFYEALQGADLERLMAVWADADDNVSCVHPGGPRLAGLATIRAAFEALFAKGAVAASPERVRKTQTADCAVHQVLERVTVPDQQGKPHSAWVLATNVYVKTTLGWRLLTHHASPGTPQDGLDVVEEPTTLH